MLDRMAIAAFTAYYKTKAKIMNLGKDENGMETIETVILIAIAVVIAGFILNFLTKGKIEGSDSDQGLIGYIFSKITKSITDIFKTDTNVNG